MVMQLFEVHVRPRGENVVLTDVARFVRLEYEDRNPRWIVHRAKQSHGISRSRPKKLLAVPVRAVVRAAEAVASVLF
ncbi:MAG: hypothetical protein ACUVT7_07260 [Thermoplasmata archaeon]